MQEVFCVHKTFLLASPWSARFLQRLLQLNARTMKGRNTKDPAERKAQTLHLRCTAYEKAAIAAQANATGLPVSRYLLERGMNYRPKERLSAEQAELLRQVLRFRTDLSRAGNLLKASDPAGAAEIREVVKNIKTLMKIW